VARQKPPRGDLSFRLQFFSGHAIPRCFRKEPVLSVLASSQVRAIARVRLRGGRLSSCGQTAGCRFLWSVQGSAMTYQCSCLIMLPFCRMLKVLLLR